jgi:hypothetical protein
MAADRAAAEDRFQGAAGSPGKKSTVTCESARKQAFCLLPISCPYFPLGFFLKESSVFR